MKNKIRKKLTLSKETVASLELREAVGGVDTFTCELSYRTCTCKCIYSQQCPSANTCPSCDCTIFPGCIQ